jgi:hypothetical protein
MARLGTNKHEEFRLKQRAHKTIDEVQGSLKKKLKKKKGLATGKLRKPKSRVQSTKEARAEDNKRAEKFLEDMKEKIK